MKLCGACSLKRKSSPGCRARNGAAPGAQKFTSDKCGLARRWSNQSLSVTAMMSRTAIGAYDSMGRYNYNMMKCTAPRGWFVADSVADAPPPEDENNEEQHRFELAHARQVFQFLNGHAARSSCQPTTKILGWAFIFVKNALPCASLRFHSSGLTKLA